MYQSVLIRRVRGIDKDFLEVRVSQHDNENGGAEGQKLVEAMARKGFRWDPPCFHRGQIDITMFVFWGDGRLGLGWKVHHTSHGGSKTSRPTFMNPVAAATYARAVFKAELEAKPVIPIMWLQALTAN